MNLIDIGILLNLFGTSSKAIKYFDNIGDNGVFIYGSTEDVMDRYSGLSKDIIGNLPDTFTICSSIFIQYKTSASNFFHLLQDDGQPWLTVYLDTTFQKGFTEE